VGNSEIGRSDICLIQHFIRPLYIKQLTKRVLIDQNCQNQPLFWRISLKFCLKDFHCMCFN